MQEFYVNSLITYDKIRSKIKRNYLSKGCDVTIHVHCRSSIWPSSLNVILGGITQLIPLYLFHVTAVEHSESLLWTFLTCNIVVVSLGIAFIYKLFTQKNVRVTGITFAIALVINYILIAIFGDPFDLLG